MTHAQLGARPLGVRRLPSLHVRRLLRDLRHFRIKKTIGLRVAAEEEDAGLDISEHGMYGYPEQFIPQPEYSTGLPSGGMPAGRGRRHRR